MAGLGWAGLASSRYRSKYLLKVSMYVVQVSTFAYIVARRKVTRQNPRMGFSMPEAFVI